jgi:CPA1 family monovalent cation:H+ antiporter
MAIESAFILLFVIATAVALLTRRLQIPYTVALVLTGLLLGGLADFPASTLTKGLLFGVFLPGLIFEAALHLEFEELRRNWLTTILLAIPGVAVSSALIALCLTPLVAVLGLARGFDWKACLVFGTLISATDPVAVVGLFRTLGAPRRLTLLLDAESLLNDGTAVVFYSLSLILASGGHAGAGTFAARFLLVVGVALLVGSIFGWLAAVLIRRVDDPMIGISLTTIAAYGSFVASEVLDASGIIAAVVAGLWCGNFALRRVALRSMRIATESFWEYVAFALNSIVFLLIGMQVHPRALLDDWLPILTAYAVVTASRAVMIFLGTALIRRTREHYSWRWSVVLTWGGLRGALPMVLALALPQNFVHRDIVISMTYGVAVISILVHRLTMSGLLRLLGIGTGRTASDAAPH